MKIIKRLKHTNEKNGITTELDILIYEKSIVWYLVESTEFDIIDELTEDQSHEDYIKNGPPRFVNSLPAELEENIIRAVKQ